MHDRVESRILKRPFWALRRPCYVHDSHDAIVSPETFELVQKELARRTRRYGRFYDSPFTGKIICGNCGGQYGHRVWHSNELCRKEIWRCNEKYDHGTICQTPTITDDEIMQAFLIAVNRIPDRKVYCEAYEREILPLIGDTSELEDKLRQLTAEHNDACSEIERLVLENAQKSQNQALYEAKYNELNNVIESKKAIIQTTRQQISETLCRRENARIFLQGLRDTPDQRIITDFDTKTWHSIVEFATVMPNRTIVFHFRNGNEESVKLEEAQ